MKRIYANLVKILEEAKKSLVTTKDDNMQKLEDISSQVSKEIDQYLEGFYKKTEVVKDMIKKRRKLKEFKVGFFKYISAIKINYIISIPFIGSMIIPAVILHIFLEIYHNICFPLYGIPRLKAGDYFVFDRQHLSYLNWMEKLFCMYCSYFNCLIAYARDIASLTELYWCPIKHARRVKGSHNQYHEFVDYLEGEKYRKEKEALRTIAKQKKGKKS